MQIKEIQRHTGITKANIRYYESQGLIHPHREENGYRVYSQADIDGLLRVKLLRALGISIGELKELQNGSAALETVLSHRRAKYEDERAQLVHSENIIKEMLSDGIDYDALDANVYLEQMNPQPPCLREDVDPKLNMPWRRFWARCLDFSLYNLILYLLFPSLYAEGGINLLLILGEVLLLLGLEPIMLCLLCTTPGKIVFGITVTNSAGGRLTYDQAVQRTLLVLRHGLGFCLPYLSDYLHYQSLTAAEQDGELIWEQDSELNIRDAGIWRYFVFVVCLVLLLAYL